LYQFGDVTIPQAYPGNADHLSPDLLPAIFCE
jgi:hypothetical protein